ncbi:serine/arginine repetitive matrix protein 2 isoform X2 [Iris pallida]|uniref:Serine/arginine repetitive matrix protein 2 isoform X2 n=1 Tax=Iris pallida TaxID=29817 RepID=A0AAX6FBJ3_IRIPA|nr:serine/arginine repetitive matrix protein 2 isoform X2 [Iris pallida]
MHTSLFFPATIDHTRLVKTITVSITIIQPKTSLSSSSNKANVQRC